MRTIKSWGKKVYNALPDADVVFAYDTVREVRVLDRRLGLVYYSIILMVFFYIVVGVFLISRKHLDTEKSIGWILCKVIQPAHDKEDIPWDIYDTITNPGEQGAVFIPTRIVETKGQTQSMDYCASPLHPCTVPADCDIGNPELQQANCVNGMCMRRQWCPAEDPNAPTSKVHNINFGETELWFKSYVHFHRSMVDVSTVEEEKPVVYPRAGANTYRVKDVVRMANLKLDHIADNGAIVILNSIFRCNFDDKDCKVNFRMINVDTNTGFNHVHNHYYMDAGVRKRDTYRMYGIRIATFATGIGEMVSFSMIILQLSSALALLGVARTAADFVLQYVVPERRHYVSQKIIQTEDFNPDGG